MGSPEGFRERISRTVNNLRGGPKPEPEKPAEPTPLASAQQIQDLFSLIERIIELKVLHIGLSSGGVRLGIEKTDQGKVAYIEKPPKKDPITGKPVGDETVIAVGIRNYGSKAEKYERRKYSIELVITGVVTETECTEFTESALKIEDPFKNS